MRRCWHDLEDERAEAAAFEWGTLLEYLTLANNTRNLRGRDGTLVLGPRGCLNIIQETHS